MKIDEMVTVWERPAHGGGKDHCVMLKLGGEVHIELHYCPSSTREAAEFARQVILDELKEAVAQQMADDYADMASAGWKD